MCLYDGFDSCTAGGEEKWWVREWRSGKEEGEEEEKDDFDTTLRQTDRVGRQPEYTRLEMLHFSEV